MIQHAHGGPGPEDQLAGGVGPAPVHIQNGGQTGTEIAVVGGHIAVAEGSHRIAPVRQLLHRQIFVREVGAEADEDDGGAGSLLPGDGQRDREGDLPARQGAAQPKLTQRGLSRAEAFLQRKLLGVQLQGLRRQLAIGLLAKQPGKLPMLLPPAGGGGRKGHGGQLPGVQKFLQGHRCPSHEKIITVQ